MKAAIATATLAALCSSASADFHWYVFGGGEVMSGQDPLGNDAAQVGTKIDQQTFALGGGGEFESDPDAFGVKPILYFAMVARYNSATDRTMKDGTKVDEELMPDAPTSYGFVMPVGTFVPVVQRDHLSLRASFGTEARVGVDRQTTSDLALALTGGLRAQMETERSLLAVSYEIAPFWAGSDRIEHRFGLEAVLGTYGLRAGYTRSQLRGPVDGFTASTLSFALEIRR